MSYANAKSITCTFIIGVLVCQQNAVWGDAIVVTKAMSASTIAEVFVENESVRIELEIGAPDIQAFQDMLPNDIYKRFEFAGTQSHDERLKQFFDTALVVQADGEKLAGKISRLTARQRIERDEVTGEPLGVQPKDAPIVIYAELVYPLSGKPKTVSLRPPTKNERVTANIGFITYHRGLPVMDFRYLSQQETLDLDWQDPWYSKFRNGNLKRQFDAPLSVFLYIEPFEVRVEAVARPIDIQRWVDLEIDGNGIIPVSAQAEMKGKVANFLSDKIDLMIDGKPASVTLDRIHFLNRTLRKTGVVYPDQDLKASSATLGVIFVCPREQLPEQVQLNWKLFDHRIKEIPSVATDEAGGLPWTLTAEAPTLTWKNFLTNPTIPAMLSVPSPPQRPRIAIPLVSLCMIITALFFGMVIWSLGKNAVGMKPIGIVVSIILCGFAIWYWPNKVTMNQPLSVQQQVSSDEALAVSKSLLHNVYRSFDRRDESIVYDQLATAVSGELLRDMYFQIMQGIKLEDQGGARITVTDIDVINSSADFDPDSPGFQSSIKWNLIGTVGHWGHLHQRANQYDADFKIESVDGSWKIVSMQIKDVVGLGTRPVN